MTLRMITVHDVIPGDHDYLLNYFMYNHNSYLIDIVTE